MKNYEQIVRRQDGSFVINNGTYHVPNEGEFKDLYAEISAYVEKHPGSVVEETVHAPTLEDARAAKLLQIDAETSAAILAGFEYEVDGQVLHFSYDANDQQNFADTANAATLSLMGVPGVPDSVTWNGWRLGTDGGRMLQRLTLTPAAFLALYMGGALAHKAAQMEVGGQRKAAVEAATTIAELEAI